jgi:phage terminase large subunit-like protein
VYTATVSQFDYNRGDEAYGGLDLAYANDLTALCWYYPKQKAYRVMYWVPEDKLRNTTDGIDYKKAVEDGYCRIAGDDVTDYQIVVADILAMLAVSPMKWLFLDPHNANQISLDLEKAGVKVEFMAQRMSNMSPPIKEVERLFLTKDIISEPNPITRLMMSNAGIKEYQDKKMLVREGVTKKIDGIVALVIAYFAFMNKGNKQKHKVWAR